jgi:hypothetical protein
VEALAAAGSLLPRMTIMQSIKELYARAESLSKKLEKAMLRYPKFEEGGTRYTNYFDATGRFDKSGAWLRMTNHSGRDIKRAVIEIEMFGKAPEHYFGGPSTPGALDHSAIKKSIAGWLWRDSAMLNEFRTSKAEFVSRHVITNFGMGTSQTLNLSLTNAVPYREARTRFVEIDYDN